MTIENRTLKQKRTFSLASSGAISALVESMRATLAGDRAALERHYSVQLEGRAEAWTLSLAPREPKLAALVKRIQIAGVRETRPAHRGRGSLWRPFHDGDRRGAAMTGRGRIAVAGWLALLAACGLWLAHGLRLTTDMSAFLPPAATQGAGNPHRAAAQRRRLQAAAAGNRRRGGRRNSRRPAAGLAEKLSASGLFDTVANGDRARAAKDLEQVFALRYALSPGVTPSRFSAEGLHEALQESLALLASPLSAELRQWLPSDPTGEMRRIAVQFANSGPATQDGVWFSKDGRRALLLAGTAAPGFDLDAQEQALAEIRRAFSETAPAGARLRIAGPGLAAVTARATVERDAARSSLIATAGILLVLLLAYRSAWPVLFSALPAASGMLAGVTAVSLWFGTGARHHGRFRRDPDRRSGWTIRPISIAQAGRGEALESTLARIGATLRLAVLTTACGALSMLLSSFNGLAQLGLLTITGVITAGLVTRWVLPALTPAGILERKLCACLSSPRSLRLRRALRGLRSACSPRRRFSCCSRTASSGTTTSPTSRRCRKTSRSWTANCARNWAHRTRAT